MKVPSIRYVTAGAVFAGSVALGVTGCTGGYVHHHVIVHRHVVHHYPIVTTRRRVVSRPGFRRQIVTRRR